MQTRCIFPTRVSSFEHQRTDPWVNMDADLATLARRMHVCKSLKLPLRHGCVGSHTACTQKNVHANFYCGVCATLIYCYKITSVA